MAILEHFIFNSDYPTDKILWMQEGEITISSGYNAIMIDTKIPAILMMEGDWNLSNSNDVYPIGESSLVLASSSGLIPSLASFMMDGTCHIYLYFYTFGSQSIGKKVKYRIWGIAREDDVKNVDSNKTVNLAAPKLSLNTDDNYPRFVMDGTLNVNQTINHNLGYTPLVKVWGYATHQGPVPGITPATYVDGYFYDMLQGYFGPTTSPPSTPAIMVTKNYIKSLAQPGYSGVDSYYYRMYIV